MKLDKYPVIVGERSMSYEFMSEGKRGKVAKAIIYSHTNVYNLYNLGFGDQNVATGELDDNITTDNGDRDKVLATVAYTLYAFTEIYPEAMIYVTGSSQARIRLYRMGINKHYNLIAEDFEVFGSLDERWQRFDKQGCYGSFLVIRKKK